MKGLAGILIGSGALALVFVMYLSLSQQAAPRK